MDGVEQLRELLQRGLTKVEEIAAKGQTVPPPLIREVAKIIEELNELHANSSFSSASKESDA